MKPAIFLLIMIVAATSAWAEDRPLTLPEIVVGGERAASPAAVCWVEVQVGSSWAFNCLNQKLKRQVDSVNPSMNVAPLDARSGDTKVGVINIPGVQQQYGRNFGISVFPYRPASPTFTSPIGRH